MTFRIHLSFCLMVLVSTSCVTNSNISSSNNDDADDSKHGTLVNWHKGTVESAFTRAQNEDKLVFIYWGAVWCPPCNEIKSKLFAHPKINDVLKDVVPVYLDGDKDYAQAWGEYFQTTGYPTLLITMSNRQELMRITEFVSIEDLERTISYFRQTKQPLQNLIDRGLKDQLQANEWQTLANATWVDAKGIDLTSDAALAQRLELVKHVPSELPVVKAILAARLLDSVSSLGGKDSTMVQQSLKREAGSLIAALMADEATVFAVRGTIVYNAEPILRWAYPNDSVKRKLMLERWLIAAQRLRQNPNCSIDLQIWSHYPAIQVWRAEHSRNVPLPSEQQRALMTTIDAGVAKLETAMDRQSVVPGAAYLLALAGLFNDAQQLLEREVERAVSPFYFYSSMARVADLRGDQEERKKWLAKASSTVSGRATRVQWLEQEILAYLDGSLKNQSQLLQQPRLVQAINDFYDYVFLMRDGFSGRSYRSVKKIGATLQPLAKTEVIRKIAQSYLYRCNRLTNKEKMRCDEHFNSLLAAKQ